MKFLSGDDLPLKRASLCLWVVALTVWAARSLVLTSTDPPPAAVPSSNATASVLLHPFKKKPLLIVHVGPPKTATTTLQKVLNESRPSLQQKDNFYYLGRFGPDREGRYEPTLQAIFAKHCPIWNRTKFKTDTNQSILHVEPAACWKAVLLMLQHHYKQGHNVIVSEEKLSIWQPSFSSFDNWTCLLHNLTQHWNIRAVVGYRRYFEWLPSAKNERDKRLLRRGAYLLWPTNQTTTTTGNTTHPTAPNQSNSTPQPILVPVYRDLYQMWTGRHSNPYPYTTQTLSDFQAVAIPTRQQVQLLNLHTDDFVSDFLCDILKAKTTCRHYHQQDKREERWNPSVSLDYDRLAVHAYQVGALFRLDKNASRGWVVNQTRLFHQALLHQNASYEFPLDCPSKEEMEPLLLASLQHERAILHAVQPPQEAQHVRAFWDYYDAKHYCTIDADATLQEASWRDFYRTLQYPSVNKA